MAAESFRDKGRTLNDAEQAHMRALESVADQLMGVLKGNKPDGIAQAMAIQWGGPVGRWYKAEGVAA